MNYSQPELFSAGQAVKLIQNNNGEKANPPRDSLDGRNSCYVDEVDD